jgi:hypothetical protein
MRFGLQGKHVPEELRQRIQTYRDGYVLYEHVLSEKAGFMIQHQTQLRPTRVGVAERRRSR